MSEEEQGENFSVIFLIGMGIIATIPTFVITYGVWTYAGWLQGLGALSVCFAVLAGAYLSYLWLLRLARKRDGRCPACGRIKVKVETFID